MEPYRVKVPFREGSYAADRMPLLI